MRKTHRFRYGFTLIELLLVIGIIGVLASIVIVAINPTRQLAQARNATRRMDTGEIMKALQQYQIKTRSLPAGIDTTLKMIGTDSSGCDVACGTELGPGTSLAVRVSASTDDAEEEVASDDPVYVQSTDLEMVQDYDPSRGNQLIGMRFQNIAVPVGAIISSASIQFTVTLTDGNGNEATDLTFVGQNSDDAATFTTAANNISTRPRTSATVTWSSVPTWTVHGQTKDTPDIAPILQEIIDRSGWASGNDIVIMVEGTGRRPADSYNEGAGTAPLLSLTYRVAGMSAAACLNLNTLTGTYLTALPLDPSLGTSEKTYYAVRRTTTNRVHVESCGVELGELISVEQ
ncbi:hypothetical protein A3F36_03135 [Candidatus Peribacteria bacterium RIFCSPHIGHO2_12_FULL_55_11]|nr:MAG: hypothetical protein A3F36_03135 [Candidatus Peribacteria bacterium RIFCSPHIGHO2_12_FULL_55_11]